MNKLYRFVEYDYGDEGWAMPLGLGHIEVRDKGPAFYLMDVPDACELAEISVEPIVESVPHLWDNPIRVRTRY